MEVTANLEQLKGIIAAIAAVKGIDCIPDEWMTGQVEYFYNIPRDWKDENGDEIYFDDYDYVIRCPIEWMESDSDGENVVWCCHSLLNGCCENTWYRQWINGKQYALGVAFHG